MNGPKNFALFYMVNARLYKRREIVRGFGRSKLKRPGIAMALRLFRPPHNIGSFDGVCLTDRVGGRGFGRRERRQWRDGSASQRIWMRQSLPHLGQQEDSQREADDLQDGFESVKHWAAPPLSIGQNPKPQWSNLP